MPRGQALRVQGTGVVSSVLLPLLPWAGDCSGPALGEGLAVPPLRVEAAPAEKAWVPQVLPGRGPRDPGFPWARGRLHFPPRLGVGEEPTGRWAPPAGPGTLRTVVWGRRLALEPVSVSQDSSPGRPRQREA